MDPIIRIINYLFKKKNIVNNDSTINSFFDNGVAFPQFVSLIFNVPEIPQIIKNPKTIFHKKLNNDLALQFLFKKNREIQLLNPSFYTEEEKTNLLALILTKQCFKINHQQVLEKCNIMVRPLNLHFKDLNELISKKCILSLLMALTNGKIQIENDDVDFNQLMDDIFKQANVPLFINEKSLNEENHFIFFIQLEVIFETYSESNEEESTKEKSNNHYKSSESLDLGDRFRLEKKEIKRQIEEINSAYFIPNDENKLKEEEEEEDYPFYMYPINDINLTKEQKLIKLQRKVDEMSLNLRLTMFNITNIDEIERIDRVIHDSELKLINQGYLSQSDKVKLYNIGLLKTVNHIMKSEELHFGNISHLFLFNFLPIFVSLFFQEDSKSMEQLKKLILSKDIDINYKTMQFLSSVDPVFDKIQFKLIKRSDEVLIGSFLTLFLNKYFLKKSKEELLERCCSILLGNTAKDDFFYQLSEEVNEKKNENQIIYYYETYVSLFDFYKSRLIHMKNDTDISYDYHDLRYFNSNVITPIIDSYYVSLGPSFPNDLLYYQLQIIFDEIDKKGIIHHIHESFLTALYKLKKVRIPKYREIASKIKSTISKPLIQKSSCSYKLDLNVDPILRIVKYLFMKNSIINKDTSINSFFNNGVSFPQFIGIIYNESKIPGIIADPKTKSFCKRNNDLALKYLFQQNQEIANIHPVIKTEEDRAYLLSLIIKKECFRIDSNEIIDKCNSIVFPLGLHYENSDDLFDEKCILALLFSLTNGKISIDTNNIEFNQLMMNSFKQAQIPLIIDLTSFYPENHFIFFIQFEIIFDIFSKKIQEISDDSSGNKNIAELFNLQIKELEILREREKEEEIKNQKEKERIEMEKSMQEALERGKFNYQIWKEVHQRKQKKSETEQIQIDKSIKQVEKIIQLKTNLSDFDRSKLYDLSILKTINAISKRNDHYFLSINEIVELNYLPTFVSIFFQNDSESYSQIMKIVREKTYAVIQIKELIKFLGTKEQIFQVLVFNFTDEKLIEASTISFFTVFLNKFFLKKNKHELLERCCSILLSNVEKGDFFYEISQEDNIQELSKNQLIYKWETYLALLTFLNERTTHFKIKNDENKKHSKYFKKKNVPQIIDSYFLSLDSTIPNDPIYYQLQFIFNAIDNEEFIYRFHENLLNTLRKLKRIKVPDINQFTKSIKAKNAALVLQQKRYQQLQIRNTINQSAGENAGIKKPEELIIKEDQKAKPNPPKTYKERRVAKFIPFNGGNESDSDDSFDFTVDFFNDYSFKKTILFKTEKKNDRYKRKWVNYISKYQSEVKLYEHKDKSINLFSTVPIQKIKHKLYKFLNYDETLCKWQTDTDVISQFIIDNNLRSRGSHPMLVFFSNSNEKDLISLNSRLISRFYPNLDDKNIYVYALCDKSLSYLHYNITLSDDTSRVKPVFLLLHVPKSKQNLNNIAKVVFHLYYFLSVICDIEITILNKNYYNCQIDMLRTINNIKKNYVKPYEVPNQSTEIDENSNNDIDNSDIDDIEEYDKFNDDSSDGDDAKNDYDLLKEKNVDDMIDDDLFFDNNFPNVLPRESKLIVLVNDYKIKGDISIEKDNQFIKEIKEQINNPLARVHYINVNNTLTYRDFLTSLCQFGWGYQFEINLMVEKFSYIHKSWIDNQYIHIKSHDNYQSALKNFIFGIFKQGKKRISNGEICSFDYLTVIGNEITKIYPSFDLEFGMDCKRIINDLKEKMVENNREILEKELNISAENNLKYLSEIINEKFVWSIEKKDLIRKNHVRFLKNEFLSINEIFCPSESDRLRVLEESRLILDKQILKDLQIIDKIFKEHEMKVSSMKSQNNENLAQTMEKGTNYTIKETENVRELKVMIETGNLTDVIDQDF